MVKITGVWDGQELPPQPDPGHGPTPTPGPTPRLGSQGQQGTNKSPSQGQASQQALAPSLGQASQVSALASSQGFC